MNDFLNAVKADLSDRRLLPVVALVALALVGAIAYAVVGGGSSSATPSAAVTPTHTSAPIGLATTETTPEKAVAEMTTGASTQRKGAARNPFTLLPEAAKAATSTPAASSPSTESTGSGSGGETESGKGSGGSEPTPAKPSKPSKQKTVYHVAVLFSTVPAGTVPLTAQLTPYENIKLLTPLPNSKQPLVIFRGVTIKGKSATFTLVGEAILHGNAVCLPSASQCQAIDLQPGHYEQLEYLTPSGETIVYELRVVSISSSKASAAAVKSMLRARSKAGLEALRHSGLVSIPFLRDSSQAGVLVFAHASASFARAHAAARHGHSR